MLSWDSLAYLSQRCSHGNQNVNLFLHVHSVVGLDLLPSENYATESRKNVDAKS